MKTLIEKIQDYYPFVHASDQDTKIHNGDTLKTYVMNVDDEIAEMKVVLSEMHDNGEVIPDFLRLSICEIDETDILLNRIEFFNTSSEFKIYAFLQHFVSSGGI